MLRKVQSDALTIAALLEDLEQRGILEDTLVVWGGEFGGPVGKFVWEGKAEENKR